MYLPPSAQWRTGRSKAQAATLALCACANAVSLALLWDHAQRHAWYAMLATVVVLLGHAAARCLYAPVGLLHWTGQDWRWVHERKSSPSHSPCDLRWVLDFQTVVLVQLRPSADQKPSTWLWLERGVQGAAPWAALRRALVASTQMEGPPPDDAGDDLPPFGARMTFSHDSTVR